MNRFLCVLLLALGSGGSVHLAQAREPANAPRIEAPQPPQAPQAPEPPQPTSAEEIFNDAHSHHWKRWNRHRDGEIVSVGHNVSLAQGEKADSVIAIFGNATSAGDVSDSVVAIFGNAHVTGPVGDSVVAIFGNLYLDSKVDGDVAVIMGNIELGPNAQIEGDLSTIGGNVTRDAAARVHGSVENVAPTQLPGFAWLKPWIKHCFKYGRPLALEPGLEWAWGLALGFFALYLLLALMFRGAVERCVETFETYPGRSILTALLAVVLTPITFVILCITLIGILLIPFVGFALFCAGLFGKTVVLATLGKRIPGVTGNGEPRHPALAVLIGGIIVLALYLVPFLGFLIYKLVGILGLGVVIYTLMLGSKKQPLSKPDTQAPNTEIPNTGAQSNAGTESPSTAGAQHDANGPAGYAASSGIAHTINDGSAASTEQPTAAAAGSAAITSALPRAGFWTRMGALAIDGILIGMLFGMLGMWLLPLAVYGALMWKFKGTTIGGMVFHLKVVRLDNRPVDWSTAIVRALGCFLSMIAAGLGFIWIAFDKENQAWHDKIAGTVVVRVPEGVSLV